MWDGQCHFLAQPQVLKDFFKLIQSLNQQGKILAYHDRSDGGCLDITLDNHAALFNEELGAVIEIKTSELSHIQAQISHRGCKCFGMLVLG